jgi:hypothetical protein
MAIRRCRYIRSSDDVEGSDRTTIYARSPGGCAPYSGTSFYRSLSGRTEERGIDFSYLTLMSASERLGLKGRKRLITPCTRSVFHSRSPQYCGGN